ncbi:endonuclease domain-containing protein [Lacibacter sediminis]|uniref:Endonuclease domain-containing protein n=1 Tax=Lacibacter sediminis TaxID=2760713 RepID=A0A7G5XM41_9BACT|nr:endonuclease domain-containing protein [Lacibacter sediminis]QNA46544.1 endonuclease domain-containing protein [Lacibacter sediminis]
MSDSHNDNLHKGSVGKLFEYARDLRKNETVAEDLLWRNLRSRKLDGLKFRRQHPLDKFIADFYCHEKRLVIEVDGSVHNSRDAKESDEGRTYELKELGIMVLRFRNEEVLNDMSLVLKKIREFVENMPDKK